MKRVLIIVVVLAVTNWLLVRTEPVCEPVAALPTAAASTSADTPEHEGCTIGVACGSVTSDGRPLLWKVRDSAFRHNEVYYNTEGSYNFISICNGSLDVDLRAWMGVNECGFAVLNSSIHRVVTPAKSDTISSNGEFMREALGKCRSVAEFTTFLDTTGVDRFIRGNFGVIDSTGAAFIFEVVDSLYWAFDAGETDDGYLIRTNFACHDSAEVEIGPTDGLERFMRSHDLIDQFIAESSLDPRTLLQRHMRDFSDSNSSAVPVPFAGCWEEGRPWGLIDSEWSICRQITVSSVVIQGVDPEAVPIEPAFLSTMWTLLGNTASTIASPYWPVGAVPPAANGQYHSPLCDASLDLKAYLFWYRGDAEYIDSYRLRDGDGGGLWATTLAKEDSIFVHADDLLSRWRTNPPSWESMLMVEDELAEQVLAVLQQFAAAHVVDPADLPVPDCLQSVYPNPFNPRTTISFQMPYTARVRLAVYDVSGRRVTELLDQILTPGDYQTSWDASALPSGPYLVRLQVGDKVFSRRCTLVK